MFLTWWLLQAILEQELRPYFDGKWKGLGDPHLSNFGNKFYCNYHFQKKIDVCSCLFLSFCFFVTKLHLWMVLIVGETNRAVFFLPGTKYEVYKYFNQKIFFLNNWNWYHYFQVEDLSHQKVQCKLHSCLFVCLFFLFRFSDMPEKTASTWIHHYWFPCEMATQLCVVQEICFNQSDALPGFG